MSYAQLCDPDEEMNWYERKNDCFCFLYPWNSAFLFRKSISLRSQKYGVHHIRWGGGTTIGVIFYLKNQVDFAKLKQKELESQSVFLLEEVSSLSELKENLESDLAVHEERSQIVSERLGDLEKVLGVNETDSELESRLDYAALTSSLRILMLAQIPSGSPVLGARTSSGYGKRIHPVTGQLKIHRGQDFAVNIGTPIYATADGVVEVTRISKTGSGNLFACYMRMDSVVRIHIYINLL